MNVETTWSESRGLHNINICVPRKKFYAVVGLTGSGKVCELYIYREASEDINILQSSLLKLILGEQHAKKGHISINGTISYSSQEPWLFPGSIRNNILFGEPYNDEKYKRVIKACSLPKDFVQLPYGDKTLVGDRGTNLSGGQCARVNLARYFLKIE